jgi:hypothetical protein
MTGVRFPAGAGNSFSSPPLCPGRSWGPLGTGGSSTRIKQPRRETDRSPQSSAEVKDVRSYTSSWCGALLRTGYIFMAWYLIKYMHNFTFNFSLNR